ncbi:centrosomal protein of 78 kDa [Erpetoichthys calabaricus]|uniref:centrosomal protein of 78 kDa n=1 Tax=Erpetoichthys calabaricus TaxID=27687 RepID=UPI00223469B2|nr:centrosomal protein of 78 kDa [Erpetoichthys calabaricus]
MLDPIQVRRRGGMDFHSYYEYCCVLQDTVPLVAVKANLAQDTLDFCGDRIRLIDWTPILNSLAINKHLHHVAIRSFHQPIHDEAERPRTFYRRKIPVFRSKDTTFRLCKSVRDCLCISQVLRTLELQGLPLRERDLVALTKGLSKAVSLQRFSLAYCSIGDEGLQVICHSVKNSSSIKTIDFTSCNLTWKSAEQMANIIKHQATKRHSIAWAESLRYRKPDLDCMSGLRRITLNCNALIGDRGAKAFVEPLVEDCWLKALDLQKCGISNEGAQALYDVLQSNATIVVLDLRMNPLIDTVLLKSIIEKVLLNSSGTNSEYKWIKTPTSKEPVKPKPRKRSMVFSTGTKLKATVRIGSRKPPIKKKHLTVEKDVCHSLSPVTHRYKPLRKAIEAIRCSGPSLVSLEDGSIVDEKTKVSSPVKLILESDSSGTEDAADTLETLLPVPCVTPDKISVKQFRRLQVELEECRLRLKEERRARAKADSRIVELELENTKLKNINLSLSEALHTQSVTSSLLEDDAVLESIEASFRKFHAFLDLLKDAGLEQLASVAGIDQSDFAPLGKPQLASSTGQIEASSEKGHKEYVEPLNQVGADNHSGSDSGMKFIGVHSSNVFSGQRDSKIKEEIKDQTPIAFNSGRELINESGTKVNLVEVTPTAEHFSDSSSSICSQKSNDSKISSSRTSGKSRSQKNGIKSEFHTARRGEL